MQFYYEGRRQLQPPVRLRTDLDARIRPCPDPPRRDTALGKRLRSSDGGMDQRPVLASSKTPARHALTAPG